MIGSLQHVKSVTIGNFTGTVTVFNSAGNTTTANATDIVRPSDWNSVHDFNVTILGNTAGNASSIAGATGIYLAGGSNVTLSMSTAASAATISLNNQPPTAQVFAQFPLKNNTSWSVLGQNSLYLQPVYPVLPVAASSLQIPISLNGSTSTNTRVFAVSLSGCLYQQDIGANSTQLTSVSSWTASIQASRVSASATFTFALNGNSFSSTNSSNFTAAISNLVQIPFSPTLIAGGTYFLGIAQSTATTGQASGLTIGVLGATNINASFGLINTGGFSGTNSTNTLAYDGGLYSATSGAWPGTIPYGAINRQVSGYIPYVEWIVQG